MSDIPHFVVGVIIIPHSSMRFFPKQRMFVPSLKANVVLEDSILNRDECKQCESDEFLFDSFETGDVVCSNCGLVSHCIIDTRSEWRTFANDSGGAQDDPNRVAGVGNSLLEGSGLSTVISRQKTPNGERAGDTMRKWNNCTAIQGDNRHLLKAMKEISRMCERINSPKRVADLAHRIYKLMDNHKRLKQKKEELKYAVSLHNALRIEEGAARTYKEIANLVSGVEPKDIGRMLKLMKEHLATEIEGLSEIMENVGTIKVGDFVPRFCANLGLPDNVRKYVSIIAEETMRLGFLGGKTPPTIVAASVLIATRAMAVDNMPTRDRIAQVSGIGDPTIRGAAKDIISHGGDICFPADVPPISIASVKI